MSDKTHITVRITRARKLTQFVEVKIPNDGRSDYAIKSAATKYIEASEEAGQFFVWKDGAMEEMPRSFYEHGYRAAIVDEDGKEKEEE